MIPAAKKIKLSSLEKENENLNAESGFHSQVELSSANLTDISQFRRKSYCLASHRGSSKQQQSLSESHHFSSGFGSSFSLSGSPSNSSASALVSPAKNRKRKSEVSKGDENFYNSYQFVSPVKLPRRTVSDKNCAKLILKEKSSSENVIHSSTPIKIDIRTNRWSKFRSFHPEKLGFGKSIEEETEKIPTPPIKDISRSLNFSSFELSSGSFVQNVPESVQNLWNNDIKQYEQKCETATTSNTPEKLPALKSETVTSNSLQKDTQQIEQKSEIITIKTTQNQTVHEKNERHFFNGRKRLDILGEKRLKSNNFSYSNYAKFLQVS